jgi:hypothetical protein
MVQCTVKGHSTQTAPLFVAQVDGGAQVLAVTAPSQTATWASLSATACPTKAAVQNFVRQRSLIVVGSDLNTFLQQATSLVLVNGAGAGDSPWGTAMVTVADSTGTAQKFEIPIPSDWKDTVSVTSYWSDGAITASASDIAVWTSPREVDVLTGSATLTTSHGPIVPTTFTASYSGTSRYYVVNQSIDFATVGVRRALRVIELQRRGTDASDTSTSPIYLSGIIVREE